MPDAAPLAPAPPPLTLQCSGSPLPIPLLPLLLWPLFLFQPKERKRDGGKDVDRARHRPLTCCLLQPFKLASRTGWPWICSKASKVEFQRRQAEIRRIRGRRVSRVRWGLRFRASTEAERRQKQMKGQSHNPRMHTKVLGMRAQS